MTAVRLTTSTRRVLAALLDHSDREMYGRELIAITGLSSGVVHPLLNRLEAHGWLSARWEDYDPVTAGRPARLYRQLTAAGVEQARAALARKTRPNRR